MAHMQRCRIAAASVLFSGALLLKVAALREQPRRILDKDRQVRISIVGDSITHGSTLPPRVGPYPLILERILNNRTSYTVTVSNLGKPGRRLTDPKCGSYHKREAEIYADIVIVMLGTNDAKTAEKAYTGFAHDWPCIEVFEDSYIKLIKWYQNLPSKPLLYMMSPPPITDPPSCLDTQGNCSSAFKISKHIVNSLYRTLLPAIVEHMDPPKPHFVDTWSLVGGNNVTTDMYKDGVHPGGPMHERMAQILADELCGETSTLRLNCA